jgi:hypothetical protein
MLRMLELLLLNDAQRGHGHAWIGCYTLEKQSVMARSKLGTVLDGLVVVLDG